MKKDEEEGPAQYRLTVAYRTYMKFTCRLSMKETLQDALKVKEQPSAMEKSTVSPHRLPMQYWLKNH